MRIWRMDYQDSNAFNLRLNEVEKRSLFLEGFKGGTILSTHWSKTEIINNKKGNDFDYLCDLLNAPIFTEKAKVIIETIADDQMEFLPIIYNGQIHYAVNILNILDIIDTDNSIEERLFDRVVDYEKISFIKSKLSNQFIFKAIIPSTQKVLSNKIFVSDEFRGHILKHELKGFKFTEIWDSENEEKDCNLIFTSHPVETHEEELDFDAAMKLVLSGNKEAISKQWRIKLNKDKKLTIGILKEDNSYEWINPIYYPPIFLTLKWKIAK